MRPGPKAQEPQGTLAFVRQADLYTALAQTGSSALALAQQCTAKKKKKWSTRARGADFPCTASEKAHALSCSCRIRMALALARKSALHRTSSHFIALRRHDLTAPRHHTRARASAGFVLPSRLLYSPLIRKGGTVYERL